MLIGNPPTAPRQKVGPDSFKLKGKDYILVTEYYSNFPDVVQLSKKSVITHEEFFLLDMEFLNTLSVTMVPNMVVVNSASLQRLMDFIKSPLVPCLHK